MRLPGFTLLTVVLLAAASVRAPQAASPPARLAAEDLGGPERFLAHVTTDKAIYRGGETLYARAVLLDAITRRPMPSVPWMTVEILGPKGDVVAQGGMNGAHGVAPFAWTLPAQQPGGQHVIRMSGPGLVPGERRFEVRAFRAPRIKSQIAFLREGHGPGDEVVATLSATRAEGGAPAGARVTLVAIVDGVEIARQAAGTLDASGRATVRFRLPETIERGIGTLALVIEDGGVVETATKTIPILLKVVDLWLYPEGGDLVAGIPTRLYLEARTPADKPADIAASIETRDGRVIATIRTQHEGRGRVRLTPVAGEAYALRITEPAGVTTVYRLPEVKPAGGVISSVDDIVPAGAPLRLRAGATLAGTHDVTVSVREREVAATSIKIARGELRRVALDLPDTADGVLRVTLWQDGAPVAERLVFRRPADDVRVSLTCDRDRYVPAGTVALTVKTTRGDGEPVSAMVALSVSDDSVRELLETRDQPPQLPVQVLVESDVRELADAAVYLNPDDPQAPRAMDLLLGTQGWRRFAFASDPRAFVDEHGDGARRVLALTAEATEAASIASGAGGAIGGVIGGVIGRVMEGLEDLRALPAAVPPRAVAGDDAMVAHAAVAPRDGALAEAEEQFAEGLADAKNEKVAALMAPAQEADAAIGFRADRVAARRQAAFHQPIREYAHRVRAGRQPGDRADFTDTVYWNAGLRTDAAGEARVTFALSDSVTSFRVLADAFTDAGLLGAGTRLVDSVEPFYLEPKMPIEVTFGDLIRLPVTTVNGTLDRLAGVTIAASTTGPLSAATLPPISLREGDRVRSLLDVRVLPSAGTGEITLTGTAGDFRDSATRTVRVVPLGFPAARSFGGTLAPGARVAHDITVPADLVPSSLRADIKLFPSSLGKLTGALERLIQEPHGCFEQTSSTTYPLIMAAQYFQSHQDVDPSLVTRSQEMLAKGYERLTSFETKTQGFEWFGESPGHEALSAFGLLEFTDMARVRAVDPAMIARTRAWLLGTRDGKGSFRRERRALHAWIEDADCSNAYILWALLQAGEPAGGLATEINWLAKAARTTDNSYVRALAANVMQLAGREADEAALLQALASQQASNGAVEGATSSIVGSSGEALRIEATSLATLAWLGSPAHQANVERAIGWLAESCQGGRYGSTQATVLALRAIVEYDRARSRPRAAGTVTLLIDGKPAGPGIAFDERTDGAIVFPDAGARLPQGAHRIELAMEGGSAMPYAIEIAFSRLAPESSPDCLVGLTVDLASTRLVEGDVAEVVATVSNRTDRALPMAIAIVALPGGLEPRHEQLKELVSAGRVAAYEVIGREIVLYFRSLAPRAQERIPLSFVAAIPGTYTGSASRAYLYYGDEHRAWVPGFQVDIAPR